MSEILKELVEKSKIDTEMVAEIVERFRPLVNKYGRMLDYEDAKNDLIERLIVIIKGMPDLSYDGQIVNYISKCIYYDYIKLSKKKGRMDYHHEYCSEIEVESEQSDLSYEMRMLIEKLPDKQKEIIVLHYVLGYKISEIAKQKNVSRQSINKIKICAIKTLKKHLV